MSNSEVIIEHAFKDNLLIKSFLKRDSRKYLTRFSRYVILKGRALNSIFLSKHKNSLGIAFQKTGATTLMADIYFLLFVCQSFQKVKSIIRREKFRDQIRELHFGNKYFYFWFLASNKEGIKQRETIDVKNAIFNKASELSLPILLETIDLRNKKLYERYGFKCYHIWQIPTVNETMYFMVKS